MEEHPNYETTIRDNPIELLKTVSVLMHDTVRAKYPYASLYDALMCLFNMRQQEQEHLKDLEIWLINTRLHMTQQRRMLSLCI